MFMISISKTHFSLHYGHRLDSFRCLMVVGHVLQSAAKTCKRSLLRETFEKLYLLISCFTLARIKTSWCLFCLFWNLASVFSEGWNWWTCRVSALYIIIKQNLPLHTSMSDKKKRKRKKNRWITNFFIARMFLLAAMIYAWLDGDNFLFLECCIYCVILN